jgi:hypothetical protein
VAQKILLMKTPNNLKKYNHIFKQIIIKKSLEKHSTLIIFLRTFRKCCGGEQDLSSRTDTRDCTCCSQICYEVIISPTKPVFSVAPDATLRAPVRIVH